MCCIGGCQTCWKVSTTAILMITYLELLFFFLFVLLIWCFVNHSNTKLPWWLTPMKIWTSTNVALNGLYRVSVNPYNQKWTIWMEQSRFTNIHNPTHHRCLTTSLAQLRSDDQLLASLPTRSNTFRYEVYAAYSCERKEVFTLGDRWGNSCPHGAAKLAEW